MTYNEWWNNVASGMQPLPNEDIEEFAHRMTALAWFNGENSEREACANVCEETTASWTQVVYNGACMDCAIAIRARGEA